MLFLRSCKNKKLYYAHIKEKEWDSKSYCDGKDVNKDHNDCAKCQLDCLIISNGRDRQHTLSETEKILYSANNGEQEGY